MNRVDKKQKVVILGLGRSGKSAARLLAAKNATVFATDSKSRQELGQDLNELESLGISLHLGGHPVALLEEADLLVVSPGIASTHPLILKAQKQQVEIVSELELAWRFLSNNIRTIAVTGTNGKSTTVSLIGHLMNAAGIDTWIGGNIGIPLSDLILLEKKPKWAVLEVSSFQLEWCQSFKPHIAAILNVTPDHLDRHGDIENYKNLKAQIWKHQAVEDFVVFNRDNKHSLELAGVAQGEKISFGKSDSKDQAHSTIGNNTIEVTLRAGKSQSYDLQKFRCLGAHNHENAAASLLMAQLAGAPPDRLQGALETFQPLPHRLEYIGEVQGVRFYNDSKATSIDATQRSLESFNGDIILIAGGRDKGSNFEQVRRLIEKRVKTTIVIGEASTAISDAWDDATSIKSANSLKDAFSQAAEVACKGDIVLFSPACASFDMFNNFEERGDAFRELVIQFIASKHRGQGNGSGSGTTKQDGSGGKILQGGIQ